MSSTKSKKWLARTLHDLIRQGWECRHNGKHVVVYPADITKPPITISTSPSDRYGHENALKDLRKAGALI